MTGPVYEYDIFLSFANADEDDARPLWQDLGLSGLRVFWSDSTLRERAGSSWFEVVQDSLSRSQHFVVLFTPTALTSEWVKREYAAFFNHCYRPPSRLLIPVLAPGVSVSDLPLFLRELQTCRLDGDLSRQLVHLLGGVDVESLKLESARLKELVNALDAERNHLRERIAELETASVDHGRRAAADQAAILAEQDILKAKLVNSNMERAQCLLDSERLRAERDTLKLRVVTLERQESYIADDYPTGPAEDKVARTPLQFSRGARGLYMFAVGMLLNASLMLVAIIRYDGGATDSGSMITATFFTAVISSVLWLLAGVLAPRRAPSFAASILLALLLVVSGKMINGVRGMIVGIAIDGAGPFALMLRLHWNFWRTRRKAAR